MNWFFCRQIPYDYYSLPYCHPRIHEEKENLGERLSGDRIENSLYKLEMKRPQACEIVCKKSLSKFQAKTFVEAIENEVTRGCTCFPPPVLSVPLSIYLFSCSHLLYVAIDVPVIKVQSTI